MRDLEDDAGGDDIRPVALQPGHLLARQAFQEFRALEIAEGDLQRLVHHAVSHPNGLRIPGKRARRATAIP